MANIKEFTPEKDYHKRARDTSKGTCRRKLVYRSEKLAREAAKRVSNRDGTLTTFYKCRFCNKFHLTKANDPEGNNSMSLSSTYNYKGEEVEVFNDAKGPYIKVDIPCHKCGGVEQGIRRLSVVDDRYTRHQRIIPLEDSIILAKAGSKDWEHKKCPEVTPDESIETPITKPPSGHGKHHNIITIELTLESDTLVELCETLNPKSLVSDSFARGAAWLFVRDIVEKIMKK